MERAGHECVGFCEFDKYAVMAYTAMHLCTKEQIDYLSSLPPRKRQKEILKEEYRNGEWFREDVRNIKADEIPRADCWCFGFPCQNISVARAESRQGLSGEKSILFYEIIRLLKDTKEDDRPSYLLIENVKGLLGVNRGWDFARVLSELDGVGYDAEWQILDSKNFVPQHRERIFIVGHLRGRHTSKVLPIEGANGKDCANQIKQVGHLAVSLRHNPDRYRVYDPTGICSTLNKMEGGGREPHIVVGVAALRGRGGIKNYTQTLEFSKDNKTFTLTTVQKDNLVVGKIGSDNDE